VIPKSIVVALTLASTPIFCAGCSRHDTEALGSIGRKIAAHTKRNTGDISPKLSMAWIAAKKEPTLQEKIQDRLRWENTLTDVTFEVTVKEKEVELKGAVKTAQQRLRAIELAETVSGVTKVTATITVQENDEAGK